VDTTKAELRRNGSTPLARLSEALIVVHDRIFSETNKTALKHLVIKLSITGFAIHLALIFLARSLSQPPLLIQGVGQEGQALLPVHLRRASALVIQLETELDLAGVVALRRDLPELRARRLHAISRCSVCAAASQACA
jgi:hypothetical protein